MTIRSIGARYAYCAECDEYMPIRELTPKRGRFGHIFVCRNHRDCFERERARRGQR